MNRRKFGQMMASGAAAFALPALSTARTRARARRAGPPNLVFIMADDLGYAHLGAYGQRLIQTPHLDRMAAEGMRFTDCYAGCTVCAPSRSVLMTGLHMGHAPVRSNAGGVPLREEDVTVGEVLQQAGYTTGAYGKWGLGEIGTPGVPTKQGFDEFVGYLHQIHGHFYYPEYLWKNEDRFPLPGNIDGSRKAGNADGARTQYAPDVLQDHTLNFIQANQDRPFFLYVPTIIPHVEVVAPPESLAEYEGRFEEAYCTDPRQGYAGSATPRAMYAAMISHLDRHVGQVLALLKELDLDDNTLVFFTSDNGAQSGYCVSEEFFDSNGPLRGYKGDFYEGGLRVPMIARWPGRIAPGVTSALPWYFPDVMPTLAELAGADAAVGTDGLSVAPTLLGRGEQARHDHLYWEYGTEPRLTQALRMGDWKGIRQAPGAALELYDLRRDVGETNDVAAAHPAVVREVEARMAQAHVPPRPQVEPVKVMGRPYR